MRAEVTSASFRKGVFLLSLQVSDIGQGQPEIRLLAKKREPNRFEHYEVKLIEAVSGTNPVHFSINVLSFFEDYPINGELIWDLFVEAGDEAGKAGAEALLMCPKNILPTFQFHYIRFPFNDLYKIKPYVTGKNNAALFIRPAVIHASLNTLKMNSSLLQVEGSISSREYEVLNLNQLESKLVFKKQKSDGDEEYAKEEIFPLPILNNYIRTEIPVPVDFGKVLAGEEWDTYIRVTTLDGGLLDVPVRKEG